MYLRLTVSNPDDKSYRICTGSTLVSYAYRYLEIQYVLFKMRRPIEAYEF